MDETVKINTLKTISNLKEESVKSFETNKKILAKLTSSLDDSEIKNLPQLRSLKNFITKERNKNFKNYKLVNAEIPECLRKNLRNEEFLRFESLDEINSKFIIFFSKFAKSFLKIQVIG
jgi:hypothetical protein